MLVIRKDSTFPVDVDKTLIFWKKPTDPLTEGEFVADYYGEPIRVTPHEENIQLLRSSIARDRNVIVWSGNGYAWAETIINELHRRGYLPQIDNLIIMGKPVGYMDDVDCTNWMGNRVYIEPHKNVYGEE